jgi:hypothetical protein
MRTLACVVLLLVLAAAAPAGVIPAVGLADAVAVRAMLGGDTWSRLVRIDNTGPRPTLKRSVYPRTVYAVVFELSGVLWFYTDADGTQSLSLTRGTVERDEADPGPLLHAIDPGFAGWSWVDVPAGPTASRRPPNACFVESVAALYRRMSAGGVADSPRLLSYYVDTPGGRLGHTVLIFDTARGLSAVDSDESDRPVSVPFDLASDPRAMSAYLRGGPVSAARTFPIVVPRKAEGRWAALPPAPSPEG